MEKQMIEARLEREGMTAKEWRDGNDGIEAVLGPYIVTEGDDAAGLYEGDTGDLTACVVGSEEHGNQRVHFAFTPEGYDSGSEVRDLSLLEAL